MPFKQRYPSIRVAWEGFLIGALAAPALAAAIGFFMWAGGANFVTALETAAKLAFFLLLVLGFGLPAAFVLKYHGRITYPETTTSRVEPPTDARSPASPASLVSLIKNCAVEMARLKADGQEPTREFVTAQYYEYNQPIWNSARQLLQIAGVVNGKSWASLDLNKIENLIERVEIADDNRVTVPHIGSAGHLRYARISTSPGEKNSYIET